MGISEIGRRHVNRMVRHELEEVEMGGGGVIVR